MSTHIVNFSCRNKNLGIALKNWIKLAVKLSMKDGIYISRIRLLDSKYFVKDCRTHHWSQNSKESCLSQCNKPCDCKTSSIKSSFSKIHPENSLLGKLLMHYTSSIAPSTSNIIVRAFNISNCSTRGGCKLIQART